jgi:hypothetical protein
LHTLARRDSDGLVAEGGGDMSPTKKNAQSAPTDKALNQQPALSKTNPGSAVYPKAPRRPDSRTIVILSQRAKDRANAMHPPSVNTSSDRIAGLQALIRVVPGTSTAAQDKRTLEAFRRFRNLTTHDLRQYADVASPAVCVYNLRHKHRYVIDKQMVMQLSPCGRLHRYAQYTLMHDEAAP